LSAASAASPPRPPHLVLAALLPEDGVRRALAGAQQAFVLDLAIELAEVTVIFPAEVADSDQPTGRVDDLML